MTYRVNHIAQIGMNGFTVECETLHEAVKVQDAIAEYDLYLLKENLRPDFSNASFIEEKDGDEWCSLDEFEIEEKLEEERTGRL